MYVIRKPHFGIFLEYFIPTLFFFIKKIFYFFLGNIWIFLEYFFWTKKNIFGVFSNPWFQIFQEKNILLKILKIFQELFIFLEKKYQLFFGVFVDYSWYFVGVLVYFVVYFVVFLVYFTHVFTPTKVTLYTMNILEIFLQ